MAQPLQDTVAIQQEDDTLDPVLTDDMLHAFAAALPSPDQETADQKDSRRTAAFIALRAFDAQGPAEAMLATHTVLVHQFAMECYRRAALSSHNSALDIQLLGTAAMLSRTMDSMLNTLDLRQDDPLWVGGPDSE